MAINKIKNQITLVDHTDGKTLSSLMKIEGTLLQIANLTGDASKPFGENWERSWDVEKGGSALKVIPTVYISGDSSNGGDMNVLSKEYQDSLNKDYLVVANSIVWKIDGDIILSSSDTNAINQNTYGAIAVAVGSKLSEGLKITKDIMGCTTATVSNYADIKDTRSSATRRIEFSCIIRDIGSGADLPILLTVATELKVVQDSANVLHLYSQNGDIFIDDLDADNKPIITPTQMILQADYWVKGVKTTDGITFNWYKEDDATWEATTVESNPNQLIVTPSDVNSFEIFKCVAYETIDANVSEKHATATKTITDRSDTYYIDFYTSNGTILTSASDSTTITASIISDKLGEEVDISDKTATYNWKIKDKNGQFKEWITSGNDVVAARTLKAGDNTVLETTSNAIEIFRSDISRKATISLTITISE
jgi:hypothetical protein